jgi:mannose-6-phosphate isomerase
MAEAPQEMMGRHASRFPRFPLLLKFLDASAMLSVQVHPADGQTDLLPEGESGKTEAWVVLEASRTSRIYAGLKPGASEERLLKAIANRTLADELASFTPTAGDAIFLRAGTVHSLGSGIVVFEVQENSDVTFRLDDWNRVDATTGQARPLQIEQALACIDFTQGEVGPAAPRVERTRPILRERLFQCEHFELRRLRGEAPFSVGIEGAPAVLVGIEGQGQIERDGAVYPLGKGEVMLLPAALGACEYQPLGKSCLLEITLPASQ